MESGPNMRCENLSQSFRMYLIHEQCASVQNHEVFVFMFINEMWYERSFCLCPKENV